MSAIASGLPQLRGETDQRDAATFPEDNSPYYRVMKERLRSIYDAAETENNSNDSVRQVGKAIDYLLGRQWSGGRPKHKSRPVLNRVDRIAEEILGLLTDIRPRSRVTPWDKTDNRLRRDAKIYNTCIQSIFSQSNCSVSLAMTIFHAMFSTGYSKLDWDQSAYGGLGGFSFIPLGVHNVLPIRPSPMSLYSGEGVIYDTAKSMGWLHEKFPLRAHLVRPDPETSRYDGAMRPPAGMNSARFHSMSPLMQKMVGTAAEPMDEEGGMAKYREFWLVDRSRNASNHDVLMGDASTNWSYLVPPGGMLYPRGRLIIQGGGDVLLHDGPNPWWHGKFPFAALRLKLWPFSFQGRSEFSGMISAQDIQNKIYAGILDMVSMAVNPGIMGPKSAFPDNVWDSLDPSKPGWRVGYNPNVPNPPVLTRPPELPGYVMQAYSIAKDEQEVGSGVGVLQKMMGKKQMPSSDTFDQARETQNTPMRLKGRMIEVFIEDMGSLLMPSIAQFWGAARRMMLLGFGGLTDSDFDGDPGTMVPAGMKVEDYIRQFAFSIEPGSLLKFNQQDRAKLLFALRKGRDIDRTTLLEGLNQLDMGLDIGQINERLKQEEIEQAAIGQAAGAKKGKK